MHRLIQERDQRRKQRESELRSLDEAFEKETQLENEAFLIQTRQLQYLQTPEGRKHRSEVLLQQVLKERALQLKFKKETSNSKIDNNTHPCDVSSCITIPQVSKSSGGLKEKECHHSQRQYQPSVTKKNVHQEVTQQSIPIGNEFKLGEKPPLEVKRLQQFELRQVLDQQLTEQMEWKKALHKEEQELNEYSQEWRNWFNQRAQMINKTEQAHKKGWRRAKESMLKPSAVSPFNSDKK